jgi:tetratricopeptide (TPR) repeat protein
VRWRRLNIHAMAIVLPQPQPAAAPDRAGKSARARRFWSAGQEHAKREDWHGAAQAYRQAAGLCSDSAYALAAIHALLKDGRYVDAAAHARRLCEREPRCALALTLESHALLNLGQPEQAVACLQALPDDVARDHDYRVSLAIALQRCRRHHDAIREFLGALALKVDHASSHFNLGMSFKDIGMKAEAAECIRTAVVLGVGSSDLAARGQLAFYEREACRWSEAESVLADLRGKLRALPESTPMEAAAFVHAVLCDDPMEQLKVARHLALHVERSAVPLPRRARARRACASAICRPTFTSTPPRSSSCRRWKRTTARRST